MAFERVVVTGGLGRLGQHVVERLAGKAEVTILDIASPASPLPAGVKMVQTTMTDYARVVQALRGHDALIHLAAIPNPRTAPPDVTFNNNVQGAWVIMQAAEDAGIKRVSVASSDSVFGLSYNPPDWPPQYLPVDEAHPCRPTEFYSLSKYITETIAASYAARGKLQVIAIRPVHVVFPPEYPELDARGSDPQNYHFWAYVAPEDVAQGFDLTLDVTYRGFDVFTISAADGLNTRPTLEIAADRWPAMPEIRRPELFKANPFASVIDITKARDVLGYAPRADWRQMLAQMPAKSNSSAV